MSKLFLIMLSNLLLYSVKIYAEDLSDADRYVADLISQKDVQGLIDVATVMENCKAALDVQKEVQVKALKAGEGNVEKERQETLFKSIVNTGLSGASVRKGAVYMRIFVDALLGEGVDKGELISKVDLNIKKKADSIKSKIYLLNKDLSFEDLNKSYNDSDKRVLNELLRLSFYVETDCNLIAPHVQSAHRLMNKWLSVSSEAEKE